MTATNIDKLCEYIFANVINDGAYLHKKKRLFKVLIGIDSFS